MSSPEHRPRFDAHVTFLDGGAVLLHTGGDRDFGRPGHAVDAPYLTESCARWLVRFTAAPPRVAEFRTFSVRAYIAVPA